MADRNDLEIVLLTMSTQDLAKQLIGEDIFKRTDKRRVSVPFSQITAIRLDYISQKYNISFGKLASRLVESALPQFEKDLGISEVDLLEYLKKIQGDKE